MMRLTTLYIVLFPIFILGQKSYYLSFTSQEKNPFQPKKEIILDSKEEVIQYLNKTRSKHIKQGYVLASVDSLSFIDNIALAHYYRGEKFEKLSISFDEEDAYIISKVPRMNERMISKLPFKPNLVEQLLKGLNSYLNNNGYPFSKVFLTVDVIEPGISHAQLHIEKGPPVKIK